MGIHYIASESLDLQHYLAVDFAHRGFSSLSLIHLNLKGINDSNFLQSTYYVTLRLLQLVTAEYDLLCKKQMQQHSTTVFCSLGYF